MLSNSNLDIPSTLRMYRYCGLSVTFLVPTKTGLEKSIMDATSSVREFLLAHGIHDFDAQQQGTDFKILVPIILLSNGHVKQTSISFYRPETKNGDPRIWIYKLAQDAEAGDLLALVLSGKKLIAINCSKTDLPTLLDKSSKNFKELFGQHEGEPSGIATELLNKLRIISKDGFITTMRPGDTGIGFTLETRLGLQANSSKSPDYKGIEIKSARGRTRKSGRTTIFSQVPNWSISRLKSSKELLYERGQYKEDKGRVQLFHSISAVKPNSYHMGLALDNNNELLRQVHHGNGVRENDVSWEMDTLKSRLREKHTESFFVYAETRGKSGDQDESFHYKSVKHTGKLDASVLPTLIETGVVTVDYTIKEKSPGVAKDQGYLFKIAPPDLDLLFFNIREYELT